MIVKLSKDQIDTIFENAKSTNPIEGMIELFKTVTPNWEEIDQMNHFPQVNKKTAEYIIGKMKSISKKEDIPKMMMTWVNNGFGCIKENMEEWTVYVDMDKIKYKKG